LRPPALLLAPPLSCSRFFQRRTPQRTLAHACLRRLSAAPASPCARISDAALPLSLTAKDGNSALDVADGEECRAALGAVALASATSRLSAILSNRRSAGGLSLARRVSSAARAAAEEDAAAVAAGGAATSVTKDGIEVAQEAPADAIEAAAMANAARPQGAVVPEEVASLLARLQLSAYARPLCGTLGLTSLAAAAYVTEPDLVRIGMKPLERRMFLSAAANGGELPKPRLSTAASADVWQLAPPGAVGEDGAPPQQLTFSIDPASLAAMLKGGAPASARISFVAASV
jgi:hypothetical protein